jgi:pSer/pThr/pTyr-binding forkhead associated (FHA) protein
VPGEIPLGDSRAHKLLVIYNDGWHAIPSPEPFSRHTGTCIVLGDRTATSQPYKIKLGDCFRLGSVGLVVAEMRVFNGEEQRLDPKVLQYLKEETMTMDVSDDVAALAADENDQACDRSTGGGDARNDGYSVATDVAWNEEHGGVGGGERFICYMCYETHDTPEDPLVAPCECKGDTRYLHVHCLQKWYQSSVLGPQSQVIRTTGNGAPACKICGSAYKTAFRKADGRKANLLEIESNRPYLSLNVVTRHDTNPGLFNTKFRLNFGRSSSDVLSDLMDNENQLLIGRSSSCNMILDYRTVSTVHAQISYEDGAFYMVDKRSSNGTMVYLQEPLPLHFQQPVRLRMGRTTLTVQTKRSMTATVREMFIARRSAATSGRSGYLSPTELQALLVVSSAEQMQAAAQQGPVAAGGWGGAALLGMSRPLGPALDGGNELMAPDAGGSNSNHDGDALPESPLMVRTASYGMVALTNHDGDLTIGNVVEEPNKLGSKEPWARGNSGSSSDIAANDNIMSPNPKLALDDTNSSSSAPPGSPSRANTVQDLASAQNSLKQSSSAARVGTATCKELNDGVNGFELESAAFLDGNGTYTYAALATNEPPMPTDREVRYLFSFFRHCKRCIII